MVLADAFRVPQGEWLRRTGTGVSINDITDGKAVAFGMHRVRGVDRDLPLDVDRWPPARFEVGCDHRVAMVPLVDLASDCRAVLAGVAQPIERSITST
ncbi:hypothetical protein [Nakamurella sp.]|uniref:hypothetical protein n=1 Tax=Nakamurella sp. TaxID=1869182 RepID=UPI003784E9D3